METANNTAMHVTETKTLCSSLNCPKTKDDKITRETEEELLYGSNEDGDDEDALSDDSFRLRVSDEGEEQQTNNRDVSNEIIKQDSTEMELGSDVSSSDITERKSSSKGENLSNGKCTIENNLNRVDESKSNNHEDSSFDQLTTKPDNFYRKEDEYQNGNSDINVNTSFTGNSSTNHWHYSGHFGHYSRRGKRNSITRQPYAMNTYNDKYYNQNNHYGRGRSCGRGYSLYHTREHRASLDDSSNDEKSNSRVSPSENMISLSENQRNNDDTILPSENIEQPIVDSSDSNNSFGNYSITKINKIAEICESVTSKSVKTSEILMKNDNAVAAYDCSNNADSTSVDNQEESNSSKCEISIPPNDHDSNEADVDVDNAIARLINDADVALAVVESTNVDDSSTDFDEGSSNEIRSSSIEIDEEIIKKETINFDEETNPNEEKNDENSLSEITNLRRNDDAPELEKINESTNDNDDDDKVESERIDESEKLEEIANDKKVVLIRPNECENDDTQSVSERIDDSKNEEKVESEDIRAGEPSVEPDKSENHETVASEMTNISETVEYEKIDESTNDDNSASEKNDEAKNVESVGSKKIDEPKNDETAVGSEKFDESKNDDHDDNDDDDDSRKIPVEKFPTILDHEIAENHEIAEKRTDDGTIFESNVAESRETERKDESMVKERENDDEKSDNDENPEKDSKTLESTISNVESSNEDEEEKSVKLCDTIASVLREKLDDIESQQATKDSSLVTATTDDESETIDDKTICPNDREKTSETKISLTDSEINAACSTNDNDDDVVKFSNNDKDDDNVAISSCSLKRTSSELLLDEMELFKRMRIGRKKSADTSESSSKEIFSVPILDEKATDDNDKTDRNDTSSLENTVINGKSESPNFESEESTLSNNVAEKSSSSRISSEDKNTRRSEDREIDDNNEKIDDCEVIEVPVKRKQKRSRRSLNSLRDNIVSQEDLQEKENVRQKRKTAQNAEEIIRKEFLGNTDSESNDSLSKFVTINHKTNNNLRAASPPTLKRNYVDDELKTEGTTMKKLKSDVTLNGDVFTKNETIEPEKQQILRHVRNFFRRDPNGSLCKLKQEELEELLIQKVVETLTMRDEIGKLREQAKVSERNQEATRFRCQQLAKQIKDFEMVLSRYKSDLRMNPDSKTVVPIKINRSVGLQVNFVTDHGIQNLRQLQQVQKTAAPVVNGTTVGQQQQQQQQQQQIQQQKQQQAQQSPQIEPSTSGATVKRTVKVRSPRRPDIPLTTLPVATTASNLINSPHVSTITPAALVVSKPVTDSRPSVTSANQQTSIMHPQLISPNQTILVNGNVTNQSIRQAPTLQASKTKNSDLIDLTQEEDRTKTTVVPQNTILTAALTEKSSPNASGVQKIAPRFHTVIQTIPSNMAITAQPGIRVVQPSSQPTPTALVNNMNAPRLTYVTMQGGMVPRQVVLTSTPTPIRPAPANNIRTTFPISGTITNSTVRVIPTAGATTLLYKHPAALPESLNPLSSPSWKLAPPAPSLKISKVANGIVLSWNMALSDKYAEIASYQLYAYQEISGISPSSTLWKKVGDVRALPLPMACTLTQFSEGNNYYFAVRAVDKHSRLGQYSQPGNISL